MAPVAERAEAAADIIDFVRERLSDSERDRFDLELFETTRHGGRAALQFVLRSWAVTVFMREDPSYQEDYEGFVEALHSENPFGELS